MKEPANRVDFSNTTGATVECAARGSPTPDIIWVRSDGTAVGDVPGLRQVQANGNLLFPPFRAEDYRQEVHAQVYACLARNSVGTIHSRDVNVRAVVAQHYDTDVNKEYVILGNSIVLKCQVPSFVADFIEVLSWHTDDNEDFLPGDNYVVQQQYESEVNNEYVIRGNSAILKCSIPSFVGDFVYVISWQDDAGNSFTHEDNKEGDVVTQYYEAEVVSEYVIRGNTAVLKCNIPSFVADFVKVEAWVNSDGGEYLPTDDIVVNQFYEAEILTEYVIRGNAAVLKCSIPSFVADFVKVEAWIDEVGTEITHSEDLVVSQYYVTEAENEYVIRGNTAIVHCKIPSFVSDFVYIEAWVMDDGQILTVNNTSTAQVVSQPFEAEADNEYVIRGNAAIMKCEVPSFVSDFVYVEMWMDSEGGTYYPSSSEVVHQSYEPRVIDEDVLRGNSAIVKCTIPSFVADYVHVVDWVADEESLSAFSFNRSEGNYAVNQFYESQVYDIYVIRGNAAVFKCHIPSFVSDHVQVVSWHDSENGEYTINENYVVSQAYTVNLMEENVLRGNSAIVKCHIPSFVTEYVTVSSWIISEGDVAYAVNLMEEYVLRGNSAILKCHIPSFVSEYVTVISWIISEGDQELDIKLESTNNFDEGKYLVLPSGELHIRDVGPEDGYKSYQCRTKHRLTGETRLSATKGRLVITEPMGRVSPKFPTGDISRTFIANMGDGVPLLCPAQGFPAPTFSPLVVFHQNSQQVTKVVHSMQMEVIASLFCVPLKLTLPRPSEPIGSKSPSFSSGSKLAWFEIQQNQDFALLCPAQGYPPIGSKSPTFSTDNKFSWYVRNTGQSLNILCPAQGFPVPVFRTRWLKVPHILERRSILWDNS
ncbi:hypothetical protein SFRURICE_013881 [Spodoptera frugiperda]|nr:hypothetical protein SFRURICE_013881 [Spodoptera frugiperda]